jgi:hypothetical protein
MANDQMEGVFAKIDLDWIQDISYLTKQEK